MSLRPATAMRWIMMNRHQGGYIDRTGEMVIEPKFAWGMRFSAGLAPVAVEAALAGGDD